MYSARRRGCVILAAAALVATSAQAQVRPPVPDSMQRFFVRFSDGRSMSAKVLNAIGWEPNDVGRSFALIAGVSVYPNMSFPNGELKAAAEDIRKLKAYLTDAEYFDEIVVLENGDVTTEKLEYFLQQYFPARLEKFQKSRFLFAYSGHGMNDGGKGFLLKASARSLRDQGNSINLAVLRVLIDQSVENSHHALILLNACYGGAFLSRSFGDAPLVSKYPGAHAITAGGTGEQTWHDPQLGTGSIFFEKMLAGLGGFADHGNEDGIITSYELASYLRREIQSFTDQNQNPQFGDISRHGSRGEFFFLNRKRQIEHGITLAWRPEKAKSMGASEQQAFASGDSAYRAGDFAKALRLYIQSAKAGNAVAASYVGWMYLNGKGTNADSSEANRWYRQSADAGNDTGLYMVGYMYLYGQGVAQDYDAAFRWLRRAADAGNPKAMTEIGYAHSRGLGVTADPVEAAKWYRHGADAGEKIAMSNLGLMYRDGRGVSQNYQEAHRLFVAAMNAGDVPSEVSLASMYRDGLGVQTNYAYALQLYEHAAQAGDSVAIGNVGYMHEKGLGVPQSRATAVEWYRKAADRGEPWAISRLAALGETTAKKD